MNLYTSAPVIVNKAVVSGMSSIVLASLSNLYNSITRKPSFAEVQETLDTLFIGTDVEVIGAFLSDMSDQPLSTSERICLEHMHCTLKDLNDELVSVDASMNTFRRYLYTVPVNLDRVSNKKKQLDHHFLRLLQVVAVIRGAIPAAQASN